MLNDAMPVDSKNLYINIQMVAKIRREVGCCKVSLRTLIMAYYLEVHTSPLSLSLSNLSLSLSLSPGRSRNCISYLQDAHLGLRVRREKALTHREWGGEWKKAEGASLSDLE